MTSEEIDDFLKEVAKEQRLMIKHKMLVIEHETRLKELKERCPHPTVETHHSFIPGSYYDRTDTWTENVLFATNV